MISTDPDLKPEKFIVACHIIHNGKILYVKRNPSKPQGNTYGSVAGKREDGETNLEAIQREVYEEIGLKFKDSDFEYVGTWKMIFNSAKKGCNYGSFTYYLYRINLTDKPKVLIHKEELNGYAWFTPEEALKHPLVEDEDGVLKDIYNL